MKGSNTIRSFISLLLICTFALGITPKKALHTWLADHQDQTAKATTNHTTSVDISGYHCNIDNIVAESPFENTSHQFQLGALGLHSSYHAPLSYCFYSLHHFYSELRGPPSLS